ncbi:MAG: polyprenyl synthetase family protein, partial [Clostridia bacterium]|nr:polyprenyl synthetase family protein [Clostridia bacterium]
LGGKKEDAINFAVALEMIHTYSLIHDDLPCMDNDDMRRGKPSCHIKFQEDTALLAGDTLLTEAFGVMSKADIPSERIVKAVEFLSGLSGLHGMIGGQVLDLQFETEKPDSKQLIDMYSRKTSGLLIAASTLGCIAAGNFDNETLENAKNYGKDLGIAFQIIDDILDCTADEKLLGKPVGSDDKNDKTTFVSIYGIEKSRNIAKKYTNSAIKALSSFCGDKENLLALTEYLLKRKY